VLAIIRSMADPQRIEGDLIDQLLIDASQWLPPAMTLEEHAEMKDELLDYLCSSVVKSFRRRMNSSLTDSEMADFRAHIEERARVIWS
jgi:hypothetical protein